MRVLLTGIAGFIGSHMAEHLIKTTDWDIVGIASFRHKGCPLRIHDGNYDHDRITMLYHDLRGPMSARLIDRIGHIDYAYNFAADSHVDRSIEFPEDCILNNTSVAVNMLEWARVAKPDVFFQISTDEVYGPAPQGVQHKEWSAIAPSNPYSASKACQEAAAIAYWRTYGVPVVLTNTMNNFGERQDPEKFIPKMIRQILAGQSVTIHGEDGKPGSRFYLHARNHADALLYLSNEAKVWGVGMYPHDERLNRWNVVGEVEMDNLSLARLVAELLERPLDYNITNFHASRPGHDLRYALDGGKLAALGWKPPVPFAEALARTVRWTLENREWLA